MLGAFAGFCRRLLHQFPDQDCHHEPGNSCQEESGPPSPARGDLSCQYGRGTQPHQCGGTDYNAHISSSPARVRRLFDERRHNRPRGSFGDAHQRPHQKQLVVAVHERRHPRQNRKRKHRRDEYRFSSKAVGKSAEHEGRHCPRDRQHRGQRPNLLLAQVKLRSKVRSEVELRHAVEEDRAPGEEQYGNEPDFVAAGRIHARPGPNRTGYCWASPAPPLCKCFSCGRRSRRGRDPA